MGLERVILDGGEKEVVGWNMKTAMGRLLEIEKNSYQEMIGINCYKNMRASKGIYEYQAWNVKC